MTFAKIYTAETGLAFSGVVRSPFIGREAEFFAFGGSSKGAIVAGLKSDGSCDKAQIFAAHDNPIATHATSITPNDPHLLYLLQGLEKQLSQPLLCAQKRAGRLAWARRLTIEGASGPSILAQSVNRPSEEGLIAVVTPVATTGGVALCVTLCSDDGAKGHALHIRLEGKATAQSANFSPGGTLIICGSLRNGEGEDATVITVDVRKRSAEVVRLRDPRQQWQLAANAFRTAEAGHFEILGFAKDARNQSGTFRFFSENSKALQLLPFDSEQDGCLLASAEHGTYASSGSSRGAVFRQAADQSEQASRADFSIDSAIGWNGLDCIDETVFLSGGLSEDNAAAIVAFDNRLACCCLKPAKAGRTMALRVELGRFEPKLETIDAKIREEEIPVHAVEVSVKTICDDPVEPPAPGNWPPDEDKPDGDFRMGDDVLIQSPLIQIETVGSDGTHAARGILARWELMGTLGQHHLPKGDFSKGPPRVSDDGKPIFNRRDDFVRLYRFPLPTGLQAEMLHFATTPPTVVDDAAARWSYVVGGKVVHLRFADLAAYSQLRSQYDPATQFPAFFQFLATPIEIQFSDFCSYRIAIGIAPAGSPAQQAKAEYAAISAQDMFDQDEGHVVARGSLSLNPYLQNIIAPNMTSLWLRVPHGQITSIGFHTYHAALSAGVKQSLVKALGRYALTLDEQTVEQRLETAEPAQVHDHWPRFSGTTVNTQSYRDKWSDPAKGLSLAVKEYRSLSETDPLAMAEFTDDPVPGMQSAKTRMSYLDILRLAASDFHIARQLGLGTVDATVAGQSQEYFYFVAYRVDLDLGVPGQRRTHISMSPPTRPSDTRLPRPPEKPMLSYGMSVTTADPGGFALTDADGYTPDGESRFVRLAVEHALYHDDSQDNLLAGPAFSLADEVIPSLFRLDYRKEGEPWRNPGLGPDRNYRDSSGVAEQVPSAFRPNPLEPAFVQMETELGIVEYRAYAIDAFSRASAYSAVVPTDYTDFRQPNRLLPPSNFRVQLVQEEDIRSLLLTTLNEQQTLSAHPDLLDKTLIRVIFDYNHVQEINYSVPQSWRNRVSAPPPVFADAVDLLFRTDLPLNCQGKIVQVDDLGAGKLALHSAAVVLASTQETLEPKIGAVDSWRFEGAALSYAGEIFVIQSIAHPGGAPDNPIFTVYPQQESVSVSDAGGQAALSTQRFPDLPAPGGLFLAVENMAEVSNWGPSGKISTTVQIAHPDWQIREVNETDPLGNARVLTYRGFWESGTLTPDPVTSHEYKLVFDSFERPVHPQEAPLFAGSPLTKVQFTKGIIRAPLSTGGGWRDLQVFAEDWANNTLYLRDVEVVNASGNGPQAIATGSGLEFNYYPSYRVYLLADPLAGLTAANILPARGDSLRQSILSACSRDDDVLDKSGNAYGSAVGVPAALLALEIRNPGKPNAPTGLPFATPPDAQDKASLRLGLTFDDPARDPFAVIFLRADVQSILSALYAPATRKQVEAVIFPIRSDMSFRERFAEIFAIRSDGPFSFSEWPLSDQTSYTLPPPDSADFSPPPNEPNYYPGKVLQTVIRQRFLPLSEQPLLFDHIPEWSSGHRPRRGPQIVRGDDGYPLTPGDAGFDIAPMAVRFTRPASNELTDPAITKPLLQSMMDNLGVSYATSDTKAQLVGRINAFYDDKPRMEFVDYTLSGSKHPDTVYFYAAQELGNRMQFGPLSEVHGPVHMVNTRPPEPPLVKSVLAEQPTFHRPRVKLTVSAPEEYEDISALRVYRSTSGIGAQSIRNMDIVLTRTLTELSAEEGDADARVVTVYDEFSEGQVPFGEPLFYRVLALRHAPYLDDDGVEQLAIVASQPSRICLTTVADANPPVVAAPAVTSIPQDSNTVLVTLEWGKASHNCTYYPSMMSESGIWQRLCELDSNDDLLQFPAAGSTAEIRLPIKDMDGNPIQYRFRIDSVNSSGLINSQNNVAVARFD